MSQLHDETHQRIAEAVSDGVQAAEEEAQQQATIEAAAQTAAASAELSTDAQTRVDELAARAVTREEIEAWRADQGVSQSQITSRLEELGTEVSALRSLMSEATSPPATAAASEEPSAGPATSSEVTVIAAPGEPDGGDVGAGQTENSKPSRLSRVHRSRRR